MLMVSDISAAVSFYQKAFGFTKRGIMNGPDGTPIHAELTLRGTTLMLGPENASMGKRTAKSLGASPASLFVYVENVARSLHFPGSPTVRINGLDPEPVAQPLFAVASSETRIS
jgi:uncharacterized glyoxalase superfamily protein PhnB